MAQLRPSGLTALAIVALLAASCGDDTDSDATTTTGGIEVIEAAVERSPADTDAADAASSATLALGFDVLGAIGSDDNLVVSPYSIEIALAMTRLGAVGTTRTEMDTVLHADMAGDLDAGLNAVDQALTDVPGTYPVGDDTVELELATANALWPQRGFAFEQPFLDAVAANYGAGLNTVDYENDTAGARKAINDSVAQTTKDRIPELVPEGAVTPETRLVLTNAVYLKAPWLQPFTDGATADLPFIRLDGTTVNTPLMSAGGSFPYATGDGFQAIELPYAGDRLAMLVIVPDSGRFDEVIAQLSTDTVAELEGTLATSQVDLRFPSFEFRTQTSLKAVLEELGMPTAFTGAADFSAMSSAADLAITDVLHEGFISVDENGTEAAAATAVIIGETAAPERLELVVDRPFLFLLRDTATGAPLFLGQVTDPSA